MMNSNNDNQPVNASELAKHTAAAQAAGFLFQFRRAIQVLAEGGNETVLGIETLDDLTVEHPSGGRILEQDKFTTQAGKAVFGDQSRNLLGTLTTWLAALLAGEISPETTHFLLVTNAICGKGLARQISLANTADKAKACLDAIKKMPPGSDGKRQLLELLTTPRGEDLFLQLCQAVELIDGVETDGATARKALVLPTPYESQREHIFDTLYGWIHSQALHSWENKQPCRISKQFFTNELQAILDDLKREKRRERPARDIPLSDEQIASKKDAVFVRQVKLVTDEELYVTDAISDYLRCFSEKTRLSKEGEITEKDWLDFSDILMRRWSNIFSKDKRLSKDSEVNTGFKIMTDVLDENFHPKLAGEETGQIYLANGTYHRFSDEKSIGWHPRYRELLEEGDAGGHLV